MARTFPDDRAFRLAALATQRLRPPTGFATDDATGDPILDFDPPLSTEEQATLADLTDVARAPVTLTPEEWTTIRPHLQALRDLRQLGRNAFMALSAAERDRMLYDAFTAQTIFDLALVRSS